MRLLGRIRSPTVAGFDISRRAFLLGVALALVVYLGAWLAIFRHVYGWLMDDRILFIKGSATVANWKHAFSYDNALQPFFFLVSYLPLKLAWKIPSHPIPLFGEDTGVFRFLLLWMVFFHVAVAMAWAGAARVLIGHRLIALLSLLLLLTSPSFILWTPQPESRIVGLPCALAALVLLVRPMRDRRPASPAELFLAGSAASLAQALHYTSLYLLVPFLLAYWLTRLYDEWRTATFWRATMIFAVALLWLPVALEVVDHYLVGHPWDRGPTATLLRLRNKHRATSLEANLGLWSRWFREQLGLPMIVTIVAGLVFVVVHFRRERDRLVLAATLPLGVAYLLMSHTMAFFRQTSTMQPFFFLFAAYAIVAMAVAMARRTLRWVAIGVGVVVVSSAHWTHSVNIFAAHQSLGRALSFAHGRAVRPGQVVWLPVAWFPQGIGTREELLEQPSDALVVSYFPWDFIKYNASYRPRLDEAMQLYSAPSLYATDSMFAELKAFGYHDFRLDSIMRDVRVTSIAALRDEHRRRLPVAAVTADSHSGPFEPANVLDRDLSPDGLSAWVSDDSPLPHVLDIEFEEAADIGEMDLVMSQAPEVSNNRVSALTIKGTGIDGAAQTLWDATGREEQPVIKATWPRRTLKRIQIVFTKSVSGAHETSVVRIEEVRFPGFEPSMSRFQRSFDPLRLDAIDVGDREAELKGSGVTRRTRLKIGDTLLFMTGDAGSWRARAAPGTSLPSGGVASLVDGIRTSNEITFNVVRPVLSAVAPASLNSGDFKHRGGSAILSLKTEGASPGIVAVFDGHDLETAFGNPRWVTILLPRTVAPPGDHTLVLRSRTGVTSKPLGVVVLPD